MKDVMDQIRELRDDHGELRDWHVQLKRAHEKLADEVAGIRPMLAQNTSDTRAALDVSRSTDRKVDDIKDSVAGLVGLWTDGTTMVRLTGRLGQFVKWAGGLSASIIAAYVAWRAVK